MQAQGSSEWPDGTVSGRYRFLQVRVNNAPIEFDRIVVHYGNGQAETTGQDNLKSLELVFGAYESARTGSKVTLPFETDAQKPIDLWRR